MIGNQSEQLIFAIHWNGNIPVRLSFDRRTEIAMWNEKEAESGEHVEIIYPKNGRFEMLRKSSNKFYVRPAIICNPALGSRLNGVVLLTVGLHWTIDDESRLWLSSSSSFGDNDRVDFILKSIGVSWAFSSSSSSSSERDGVADMDAVWTDDADGDDDTVFMRLIASNSVGERAVVRFIVDGCGVNSTPPTSTDTSSLAIRFVFSSMSLS